MILEKPSKFGSCQDLIQLSLLFFSLCRWRDMYIFPTFNTKQAIPNFILYKLLNIIAYFE